MGVSIEGLAGIHWKTLRGRDKDSLVDHLGGGVRDSKSLKTEVSKSTDGWPRSKTWEDESSDPGWWLWDQAETPHPVQT